MFQKRTPILLIVIACLALFSLTSMAQDSYNEAPMLADMVAAGDLPPVEERLPENPVVMEPLEEIGTYGGTLRRGTAGIFGYMTQNMTREPLAMWNLPLTGDGPVQPNLATGWESNEEFTEWTVFLREGVKWSDGEPFTTSDIEFFWNDIALDENVTDDVPSTRTLFLGGEPPELEIIDDFTIKFIYPAPFPSFVDGIASMTEIAYPRHLLEPLHPAYNDDADYETFNVQQLLEEGRGRVTLQAWMLDEYVAGEFYNLVRNPYYWKVDPAGNQLPYFDRVTVEIVEDRQAVALGNVTGQFDMDALWVGVQHLQLFSQAIQDGRDISLTFADFAGVSFHFNMDIEDPVKRAAFRDVNFRRAFSLALNRQEIGDVFYSGLFTPAGSVFAPDTGYYTEEDAALWSAYDPEGAMALLDDAGYVDVDGDGFRENPDGEALQLIIEVGVHDLYTPVVELVTEYLVDIGLNTILDADDQTLVRERFVTGDFGIHTWDADQYLTPLGADVSLLIPADPNTPPWHINWEEDPVDENFLRTIDLIAEAQTVPAEARIPLLTEVSHLHADNVWIVATGFWQRPFIKNNRIGNAPDQFSRNSLTQVSGWNHALLFAKYEPGEGP